MGDLRQAGIDLRTDVVAANRACELLKSTSTVKFDATAEAHIRLGIDPKYNDQQVRATVALPKGTGNTVRVAVVCGAEQEAAAREAGAVHVAFGKISFSAADLQENLGAIVRAIQANKPTGAKGDYFKSMYVVSTMGPSMRVDPSSFLD